MLLTFCLIKFSTSFVGKKSSSVTFDAIIWLLTNSWSCKHEKFNYILMFHKQLLIQFKVLFFALKHTFSFTSNLNRGLRSFSAVGVLINDDPAILMSTNVIWSSESAGTKKKKTFKNKQNTHK